MIPCDSVPASDVRLEVWPDLVGPLTVENFVLFSVDDAFLSSDLPILLLLLLIAFEYFFAWKVFGVFCSVAATSDIYLVSNQYLLKEVWIHERNIFYLSEQLSEDERNKQNIYN